MSTVTVPRFLRYEFPGLQGANRLDVLPSRAGREASNDSANTDIDWEEIHRSVQTGLRRLARAVMRSRPEVRSYFGRTITHLLLFSYCTFEVPSLPELDSIVAGVDFSASPEGGTIVVHADLSGEESGVVWLNLPPVKVPAKKELLRRAGETLAQQLAEHASDVDDVFQRRNALRSR